MAHIEGEILIKRSVALLSMIRVLILAALAAGVVSLSAANPAQAMVRGGAASEGISAHLDKLSFTAAQAGFIKLSFRYASAGTRIGYLLSLKKGAAWMTVRSVSDMGGMQGVSNTRIIRQLFGSTPVKIGQYRLKLSSDESSLTLSFTVLKPPTVVPGEATPRAGHWTGNTTSATSAPVAFSTTANHRNVVRFSFKYSWQQAITRPPYGFCSIFGTAVRAAATPIAGRLFKVSGGSFSFSGTFDSPIRAHGTVELQGIPASQDCGGHVSLAPVPWSATWERAS